MQNAALVVRKIVTFIVGNEFDHRPLGQRCRLVQDEPAVFDARSEKAHVLTLRVSGTGGKRSSASGSFRHGPCATAADRPAARAR